MKISITKRQEEYLASLVASEESQNVDEAVQDAVTQAPSRPQPF